MDSETLCVAYGNMICTKPRLTLIFLVDRRIFWLDSFLCFGQVQLTVVHCSYESVLTSKEMNTSYVDYVAVTTGLHHGNQEEVPDVVIVGTLRCGDDFLFTLVDADWLVAFYGVGAIASLRAVFRALSSQKHNWLGK